MTETELDLFVIGAGSGGVRAARVAAGFGARVAVAESYRAGGTCVIRGCIPKKLLVYASQVRDQLDDARGFGWSVEGRFDWPSLIEAKDREIRRLELIYRNLLENAGAQLIDGHATLIDAHAVDVGGQRFRAQHVLIATGASPERPSLPGIEHSITSNEAFDLPQLPRRVLVVGGGYVALEFAGILHGLGARVTLAHRGTRVLRGFDEEIALHLQQQLALRGLDLRLSCVVQALRREADGSLAVSVLEGGAARALEVDAVLYATGRRPNTQGLGLERVGVTLDEGGAVVVDQFSRSSVPSVHAVGDVTNRIALTPVAIREGQALATTLFGGVPTAMDHRDVPHAVFCQPPVAVVGMNEADARAAVGAVEVYRASFRPLKNTVSGRTERTLVKLVVDAQSDRVLGAHMVGADAPEIIQGLAIGVKAGLTKAQFDATVALHPTAAEEFVTL